MIVNPAEAIPAPRNAAFPGAVLMFIGAYLVYLALGGIRGSDGMTWLDKFGIGKPSTTAQTTPTASSSPSPASNSVQMA